MDIKMCQNVILNKKLFVPHLFTVKQINIMEKYLNKAKMSNTEKTYLYSTIKKKLEALMTLKTEYFVSGNDMIKARVKEAMSILKELNQEKAFISGSFLYSKKFNDIDIYIISKKRKQYHKGNMHLIFITEKDLRKSVFISASKYSVSNFFIEQKNPVIKRPSFNDLVITYEMAINEILDNDDQKTIRDIVFEYYMQVKNVVLDSFSLCKKTDEIIQLKKEEKIEMVNDMAGELLIKIYSPRYLYSELTKFLKTLNDDIANLKVHDNFIIYHDLFKGIRNECRRAEA